MKQKSIFIILAVIIGFILLLSLTQRYYGIWGTMGDDAYLEKESGLDSNNNADNYGINLQEAPPSEDDVEVSIEDLTVPEAVSAVRAQVVANLGLDEEEVTILGFAIHQDWENKCTTSEGLDEECAATLEPGYEVEVLVQDNERIFRSNADGSVVREEK